MADDLVMAVAVGVAAVFSFAADLAADLAANFTADLGLAPEPAAAANFSFAAAAPEPAPVASAAPGPGPKPVPVVRRRLFFPVTTIKIPHLRWWFFGSSGQAGLWAIAHWSCGLPQDDH